MPVECDGQARCLHNGYPGHRLFSHGPFHEVNNGAQEVTNKKGPAPKWGRRLFLGSYSRMYGLGKGLQTLPRLIRSQITSFTFTYEASSSTLGSF